MATYLRVAALAAPLALMACAGNNAAAQLAAAQDEACTAAVANQIGMSAGDLVTIRQGRTPTGAVVMQVSTPEEEYSCTIDDQLVIANITSAVS